MSKLTQNPFEALRRMTPARVGLGRSGAGFRTETHLEFQFAHARARDAVHHHLDWKALTDELSGFETIHVESAAPDRATYLRRPDLGRKLSDASRMRFTKGDYDLVFVIADGLSSDAVQAHGAAVIKECMKSLPGLKIGPLVLASQARVAIGDEIGDLLGARLVVLLVGERPGLTVADSLGAYLTFDPKPARMDSERNCISNIHTQGGLTYGEAAHKIAWLCREALRLKLSGTGLKENADQNLLSDSDLIGDDPRR